MSTHQPCFIAINVCLRIYYSTFLRSSVLDIICQERTLDLGTDKCIHVHTNPQSSSSCYSFFFIATKIPNRWFVTKRAGRFCRKCVSCQSVVKIVIVTIFVACVSNAWQIINVTNCTWHIARLKIGEPWKEFFRRQWWLFLEGYFYALFNNLIFQTDLEKYGEDKYLDSLNEENRWLTMWYMEMCHKDADFC